MVSIALTLINGHYVDDLVILQGPQAFFLSTSP
jgi:hypothetical protein